MFIANSKDFRPITHLSILLCHHDDVSIINCRILLNSSILNTYDICLLLTKDFRPITHLSMLLVLLKHN